MKICFFITGLGIGGAEKFLVQLVPKLKFDKFVISLTNKNILGKEIEKKGVKVYYLGLNKINFFLIIFLMIFRIGKILKKEKPDIVDTYLIHSNIFGRLLGRLFGVKKNISSIRNDYSDLRLLNFLERLSQNLVDLYISNSKALLNYIHYKNHVPLRKIKIIPNAIDIKKINSRLDKNYDVKLELGLKKNNYLIVCVARLHKQKNVATLIKAMDLIDNNIFLVIVGDGPERKNLIQLTVKLQLKDKIFFLGFRRDVLNIVNSSNVFILPSLKEGMSNALLEAMALKKVCIVSDIPQNKELIKDRINGIVFNQQNEKDLAKKIMEVYENENLMELGQKAFKLIENKFDLKKVLGKYEKIIKNIFYNTF